MNSHQQASALTMTKALAHRPAAGLTDKSEAGKGPQQRTQSNEFRKYRIDKNGYG
jgi:hypothetical protein